MGENKVKLMTREELAKYMRCGERTIYRAEQRGDLLRYCRNPIRFAEEDVVDWLNECRTGMAAELTELPEKLFLTEDLPHIIGVSFHAIRRWLKHRAENQFPTYRMTGTLLLYNIEDIVRWLKNLRASYAVAMEARRKEYEEARALLVKRGLAKG